MFALTPSLPYTTMIFAMSKANLQFFPTHAAPKNREGVGKQIPVVWNGLWCGLVAGALLWFAALTTAEAAAINCGQTISGTINGAVQTNSCTFSGSADEAVVLSVHASSGGLAATADLYGPGGNFISSIAQGGSASLALPTTGTYTILVHDYYYTSIGDYGVCLSFVTGRCGTPIVCGQTLTNAISAAGQANTYTFSGMAGEAVVLSAHASSGVLAATADLYGPAGTFIGSALQGATSSLSLPATGTYTILVHDYYYTSIGNYGVGLGFATGRCGTPIVCGQTLTNAISAAGQANTYTFSGTAGEAVVLSAHASSGVLAATADLYGPAGTFIGSALQGATSSLSLLATGTYTILVHDYYYTSIGNYGVGLGFVTGRCGTAIVCGQTLTNAIKATGQANAYTFSGTAGERVVLSAHSSSGSLGATADLYGPTGTFIGSALQGASGSLSLPATGTYTILVHDYYYTSTGNYGVGLGFVTGRCGTAIVCGQTVTNAINTTGQANAYTFSGTAGERVVLSTHSSSGSLGATADLYGPTGTFIGSALQGASGSLSLPATGTYTILVHDYYYTSTGNYGVSLTNLVPGLSSPFSVSRGKFQMQLNGLAGQNYTLLATTNMSAPTSNWFTVLVTNLSVNSVILQDNQATNQQRFYRVRIGP
jgi:large repetitive protein